MSKRYVRVESIMNAVKRVPVTLMGFVVSFALATTFDANAAELQYKTSAQVEMSSGFHVPFYMEAENAGEIAGVEFFMGNNNTTLMQLDEAYSKLTDEMPEASEMEPAYRFVFKNLGDIRSEKVAIDFDATSKVLNVAFRLPGDMLLSVMKPLDTMDDDLVMFNLYHLRELLVSDFSSVRLLRQYVHNVELRNLMNA